MHSCYVDCQPGFVPHRLPVSNSSAKSCRAAEVKTMTFKSQPLYGVQVVKEAKSFEEGVENLVYGMIEESEQEELRSLDDMGVEVQVKACCINYPEYDS